MQFLLYRVRATEKQTVKVEETKSDDDFEKGTVGKKAWLEDLIRISLEESLSLVPSLGCVVQTRENVQMAQLQELADGRPCLLVAHRERG